VVPGVLRVFTTGSSVLSLLRSRKSFVKVLKAQEQSQKAKFKNEAFWSNKQFKRLVLLKKKKKARGTRLVQSEEHATLDLGVVGSSPTLSVEINK